MVHKRKNNTNTYVLDTTICTQTQITQIRPLTNNWRNRRTEHNLYAEIVTDIITRTTEYINKVTQMTRSEMFGSLQFDMASLTLCFYYFITQCRCSLCLSQPLNTFLCDFTIQVTLISKCIALIFNLKNIPGVQESVYCNKYEISPVIFGNNNIKTIYRL